MTRVVITELIRGQLKVSGPRSLVLGRADLEKVWMKWGMSGHQWRPHWDLQVD